MRLILIIIATFVLSSCRKNDLAIHFTLPPETESGQITLGFILDSQVWRNYGQVCFPFANGCHDNLTVSYLSTNNGMIILNADRVLLDNGALVSSQSIGFSLADSNGVNSTGVYPVRYYQNSSYSSSVGFWFNDSTPRKIYGNVQNRITFFITVTRLDTISHVFSGKFYGTLFNISKGSLFPDLTDSIVISEGRFDTKLK